MLQKTLIILRLVLETLGIDFFIINLFFIFVTNKIQTEAKNNLLSVLRKTYFSTPELTLIVNQKS